MEILFFITFILAFLFCITIIRFKKLQSLINSYTTSLMLFFYVICFRLFAFAFLPKTENPPASSLNGSEWFSSFVLVSILFFSYVLGFFIAYVIKKNFCFCLNVFYVCSSIIYFLFQHCLFHPFLNNLRFLVKENL